MANNSGNGAKLIVALFGLLLMAACSWWGLYWGWGLTVKDWGGVIVPFVFSVILYTMIQIVLKMD